MGEELLDWLEGLSLAWRVIAAAVLPFGETVALLDAIVPGEIGLAIVAASTGWRPELVLIYVAAVIGASAGDTVSWYVGSRWGERVLRRSDRVWRRLEHGFERAVGAVDRHGHRAIFVARFFGPLRAVVPLVAGTAGLPFRRFMPWNIAASVIWAALVVSAGARWGRSVIAVFDRIGLVSLIVIVGLIVLFGVVRATAARRQPESRNEG